MSDYIFKRPTDKYTLTLKPMDNYLKQASNYLQVKYGLDNETAIKKVKKFIKLNNVKDPVVNYRYRDDNGDRTMETNTLNKYINEVIDNGEILTPTFTVNDHPSKKRSLHADYLKHNIDLRKIDKGLAFKYKQEGDPDKYLYHNTLQKVRKIFNNSLSGAYASKSTILSFPSNHSILTSITRSVASIGNSVSESIISGNKHFKSPDVTLNYINAIVTDTKEDSISYVLKKYNLHTPSTDEVMVTILKCSRDYWEDKTAEANIKLYVSKLTGPQRANIVYTNDLYHLRKYNEAFVKDMLFNISERKTTGSTQQLNDINNTAEGIMNLVHHICMYDVQNKDINYTKLVGTELLTILASTAKNVTEQLNKYKSLFRVFLTSDILPVNIGEVKDMIRECIVLSDTDSTCGAYDTWVQWYYGNTKFTREAVALSATVMTINTQAIDHNIKVFAKNMNIESNLVEYLKMKNEFFWSSFTVANVSKHYYADTWIQEGNVFKEAELELKGVHLISSAGYQKVSEEAHAMMTDINLTISKGIQLDPTKYIKQVMATEKMLIDKLKSGDTNMFKTEKIKDPGSYKLDDKSKTPYFYHLLWKEVFSENYGNSGEPEYMVVKVPTTLAKPRALKDYIESIDDVTYKTNLSNVLSKNNKTSLGIMRVPLSIAAGKGLPTELLDIIDIKRMVTDSLNVMYIVLETIGVFIKKGLLVTESNLLYEQ